MTSFFALDNETTKLALEFTQFPDSAGFLALLNLTYEVKAIIIALLLLDLIVGLVLRTKVISYLRTNDCKRTPLNNFFFLDQINGGFLGLNIVYTVIAILIPYPISTVIGYELCNWADLFGCLYIAGSNIWSSAIAVLRDVKLIRNRAVLCKQKI